MNSNRGGKRFAVWHWILQRLSGALLVPVSLWFVWSVLPVVTRSPSAALEWFQPPLHTAGALVWTGLIFYHGLLGIQVIIEDYISCQKIRALSLLGLQIMSFGAVALGVFQLMRLQVGI